MKISKIKMDVSGLKGLLVNYLKTELKDGLTFQNEYSVKYRAPVHRELKKLIFSLDKYVIDICHLNEEAEVEITGITANDKQFLITAKLNVLEGSVVAINTPNITEGMYAGYGDVMKLIDEIYKEVDIYATKKVVIDQKQFVMDLFSKDLEKLNSIDMSDSDAVKKEMTAYLEKAGCIVMEREEEPEGELSVAHSDPKVDDKKEILDNQKVKVG